MILPRLQALLSEQPTALQTISRHFAEARDMKKMLRQIGLDKHPTVLELQHRWRDPHRSKTEVFLKSNGTSPVIFHVDGQTLFQDLSTSSMLQHGTLDVETDIDPEMAEEEEPPTASVDIPSIWSSRSRDLPLQDTLLCKYACVFATSMMKEAPRDQIFSLGGALSC